MKQKKELKEKEPENFQNRNNYKIYIALLFLCVYGLIMIYSITALKYGTSKDYNYNSFYIVGKQALFMLGGFVCIFIFQFVNYRCLKLVALPLYIVSVVCIGLLATPLGVNVKGATRWLDIGVQFQVSELVKLGCIVGLAWFIAKYEPSLHMKRMTVYIWLVMIATTGLLFFLSDDFSSSVVLLGIFFVMSLVCTKTKKMHAAAIIAGIIAASYFVYDVWTDMPTMDEVAEDFRRGRIAAWLAPDSYPSISYQWYQGMYAVSRGGFLGKGLGNSLQKNIIPEPHNDFIFTILVEEMGFVGGSILILLVIYLVYQIICVALSTKDMFGRAMLVGIAAHIGIQTVFNIGVTLGALPNTGLPLPFISYGGTSILILIGGEMAIVFSVERSLWYEQFWKNFGVKKRRKRRRKGQNRKRRSAQGK